MASRLPTDFNADRTFGVEIEMNRPSSMSNCDVAAGIRQRAGLPCYDESYNHRTRSHWKVTTDASLGSRGAEVVSPVLAGQPGLQQIQMVCDALEDMGCTVNVSCGLHVHHDVRDFDIRNFKNLAKLYVKLEGAIDKIMPPSRRSNSSRWCRGYRATGPVFYGQTQTELEMVTERVASIDRAPDMWSVIDSLNAGTRYTKLNLHAYSRQGTVEFRQHSATVNGQKIIHWVKLTQAIVERAYLATTIRVQGMDKFSILIKFCPDRKTKAFYRKRAAHFERAEQ